MNVVPLTITTYAGAFIPITNVAVQNTTFNYPFLNNFSTNYLYGFVKLAL